MRGPLHAAKLHHGIGNAKLVEHAEQAIHGQDLKVLAQRLARGVRHLRTGQRQ
ncbi:hypothetical protein [Halomonas alkalicola]|uniref:Uncharacterized protein n=1 Tax=Halomonas alkalicola TaxID=1930622 RepID=A0ABY9H4C6_9GAMM|nr:hypothetical protein [Halomonas alkalicola]WLI73321.1 hypothetical protein B6N23_16650 [Halomonas alkalicola]